MVRAVGGGGARRAIRKVLIGRANTRSSILSLIRRWHVNIAMILATVRAYLFRQTTRNRYLNMGLSLPITQQRLSFVRLRRSIEITPASYRLDLMDYLVVPGPHCSHTRNCSTAVVFCPGKIWCFLKPDLGIPRGRSSLKVCRKLHVHTSQFKPHAISLVSRDDRVRAVVQRHDIGFP